MLANQNLEDYCKCRLQARTWKFCLDKTVLFFVFELFTVLDWLISVDELIGITNVTVFENGTFLES